ncbi:MAG: flagellar motor switch protein FliG [Pedosphaera sp. Tous-C6FEB]|nr:MAG: flagellar motor switch protein FliG [Pedosphaera sp. Tous-C6FEB]
MPDSAEAKLPGLNYALMTKQQRFAAFLIILGPETAATILRQLEVAELEAVTLEMSKLPFLTQDFQNEVLKEFSSLAVQATLGICGGMKFVNAALEKGVGAFRASDVMNKVSPTNNRPIIPALQNVLDVEPRALANLLKHEPAQAIALVVSYLAPDRASRVLAELPEAQRDSVVERMATLAPAPVETVERLANALNQKISNAKPSRPPSRTGGVLPAAAMLNAMDRETATNILNALEARNPDLTQSIRNKMFTFEDLAILDTPSLQKILREVDLRDLAMSLKSSSEKLKGRMLGSISKRAAETVNEEISFMGSVRGKDGDAAKQRIIEAMRKLETAGEIDLNEAREASKAALN